MRRKSNFNIIEKKSNNLLHPINTKESVHSFSSQIEFINNKRKSIKNEKLSYLFF